MVDIKKAAIKLIEILKLSMTGTAKVDAKNVATEFGCLSLDIDLDGIEKFLTEFAEEVRKEWR